MSAAAGRLARAVLSCAAEPGDPVLGALLRAHDAAEILAVITGQADPAVLRPGGQPGGRAGEPAARAGEPGGTGGPGGADVARALARWQRRAGQLPAPARIEAWLGAGLRLVAPGDPEWPTQLDDLGDARPVVLWLRGRSDLRYACLRSVSLVGARAATAYGSFVATEMGAALAERGCAVVSGGAYGVDAAAHRGALAGGGLTVAMLASGLGEAHPRGHHELFGQIAAQGVLVTEVPPDRAPTRPGFLIRNRLIAALSRGTVVVEAAARSGALNTAKHARELCRPLMAVPGPVTSPTSAGCHELLRAGGAACVTSAADVLELTSPLGGTDGQGGTGPAVPRSGLDEASAAVLAAVPSGGGGRGPAAIAVRAGTDLDTVLRCLGLLAAAGHIERCEQGWRARRGQP